MSLPIRMGCISLVAWAAQLVPSVAYAMFFAAFTDYGYKLTPAGHFIMVSPEWAVGCIVYGSLWALMNSEKRSRGPGGHQALLCLGRVGAYWTTGAVLSLMFRGSEWSGVGVLLSSSIFPVGNLLGVLMLDFLLTLRVRSRRLVHSA